VTASEDHPGPTARLDDQIRALADRLTALEKTVSQNITPLATDATGPGAGPAASAPPAGPPEGATLFYSGAGQIGPFQLSLRRRERLDAVLSADPALVARELAALASPVRVVLLRAMLGGPQTSQQLRDMLDASSAGPLYHHLKELISAGLVIQPERNLYAIPPSKAVTVCVTIMAATHLAETSHQAPPPPPGPLADNDQP
jgi:DNA-binding HxlR family transcriptional regulator